MYIMPSREGLTNNPLDAKTWAAIMAAQQARRRRDMRWCDYVGTIFLAATCTVILMLCIS